MIKKTSSELHLNVNKSFLQIICIAFCAQTISFFIGFSLERAYTIHRLGFSTIESTKLKIHAVVSGVLSDLWMSGATALFLLLLCFLPRLFKGVFLKYKKIHPKNDRLILYYIAYIFLCIIFLFLNSLHISYVDFFGGLINPHHLKYLFDTQFLSSSANILYDDRILLTFMVSVVVLFVFHYFFNLFFIKNTKLIYTFSLILVVIAPMSQIIKVQMNTKKFTWTPKILRINYLENLVEKSFSLYSNEIPNAKEAHTLSLWLQNNLFARKDYLLLSQENVNIDEWKQLLQRSPIPAQMPIGVGLKETVKSHMQDGNPLFVWVVLIESFRPEDGNAFFPNNPLSFQPYFDKMNRTGISFANAWTVGGVTRAGQEAIFCGLWSGETTSAMRDIPSLDPSCTYEFIKESFHSNSRTGFWHGGYLEFDGQGSFWRKHGTEVLFGQRDFSPGSPKTLWGVSDLALFHNVIHNIKQLKQQKLEFHTILTTSNHSDWQIPSDRSKNIDVVSVRGFHPSQVTTLYTDEAIQEFVHALKTTQAQNENTSIWDNSLIIFANDHGGLHPSFVNKKGGVWGISEKNNIQAAVSYSRAHILFQGGIVHKTLSKMQKMDAPRGVRLNQLVSQADIFPTVLDILGIEQEYVSSLSDSLFVEERRWPVVVDLGERVFVPNPNHVGKGMVWFRKDFRTSALPDIKHLDAYNKTAFHLFRAYQYLLESGAAGRN